MRRVIGIISTLSIVALLTVPYTNCDSTSQGDLFKATNGSFDQGSCLEDGDGSKCYAEEQSNIEISSVPYVLVSPNQEFVNIAGECNDGNYPLNVIHWEVYRENFPTPLFSDISMKNFANLTGFKCEKGRFALNIKVPIGLIFGGAPVGHYVMVDIVGIKDGVDFSGIAGAKKILLKPRL